MKSRVLFFLSLIIFTGTVTIWSCKKDDEKTATKEEAVAVTKSNLNADYIYDDLYKSTEDIMIDLELNKYPAGSSKKSIGCFTYSIDKPGDTLNFPKKITITYNNCNSNGLKKNGKIIITQNKKIRKPGAIRTITMENFIINDTIQVEGKKTIENRTAVNGKPTIQVTLENGKLTFSEKTHITRNFTRTITWTEGYQLLSLLDLSDDKYAIYQKASGSTKEGIKYSSVTTDSLVFKLTDMCIKKGKIEMNVGSNKVYVDLNRTNCWDKIKIIIGPDTYNVDLLLNLL